MKKRTIYLVGIAALGISYDILKSALPPPWFLIIVTLYLIALKIVLEKFGR